LKPVILVLLYIPVKRKAMANIRIINLAFNLFSGGHKMATINKNGNTIFIITDFGFIYYN